MRPMLAVVAALLLTAAPLAAQTSLAVGGAVSSFGGEDFEGARARAGVEAVLGRTTSESQGSFLGIGAAYSKIGTEVKGDEEATLWTAFVDVRHTKEVNPNASPYFGTRIGLARRAGDLGEDAYTSPGWFGGAHVGVFVRGSPRVRLDLSAGASMFRLGDVDVDGTALPGSTSSGHQWSFRIAVVRAFR